MKFSALVISLAILVTSCASSPSTVPSPTLDPSPIPTPTPIFTPTPTATPEATASPFGGAVFPDPDACTNRLAGYRIAYPDQWYSNAAVANPEGFDAGIPACVFFAPRDFTIVYGSEPPPEVAISIGVSELPEQATWDYDPPDGYAILKDTMARIAGHPARLQVLKVLYPNTGFVSAGERLTQYIVDLGENRYFFARTSNSQDYDASREVLMDMMRTLEVIER